MYTYVCVYIYIYIYIHTHVSLSLSLCVYIYIYIYIHTHIIIAGFMSCADNPDLSPSVSYLFVQLSFWVRMRWMREWGEGGRCGRERCAVSKFLLADACAALFRSRSSSSTVLLRLVGALVKRNAL